MSIIKPTLPAPWQVINSGELNDVFTDLQNITIEKVNIAEEGLNTNHFEKNALVDFGYSFLYGFPTVALTVDALNVRVFQNLDIPLLPTTTLDEGELIRYSVSVPITDCTLPTNLDNPAEAGEQVLYFKLQLELDFGSGSVYVDVNEARGFALTPTGSENRVVLSTGLGGQYIKGFYYQTINLTGVYFARQPTVQVKGLRLQYTFDSSLPTVNAGTIYGFVLAVRR